MPDNPQNTLRSMRPIVFIHGSGDSARIWRLQAEYFGPQRAFAIDLPGHGQRPDRLPAEVTVYDYASAARDIIRDELRLEKPFVAGHSLGGAVALALGLDYGDELAGLILVGTGARLRVHPDLLEGARTSSEASSRQLKALAVAPTNEATMPDLLMQEQAKEQTAPTMLYRDLSACNIFDCMARLQEIHLRTLIITGVDDRLTPIKYGQYLHEHIAGSTLRIVPAAGHYVMREQPQAVNEAIEAFVTRIPLD